jgi:hypothetical protein
VLGQRVPVETEQTKPYSPIGTHQSEPEEPNWLGCINGRQSSKAHSGTYRLAALSV